MKQNSLHERRLFGAVRTARNQYDPFHSVLACSQETYSTWRHSTSIRYEINILRNEVPISFRGEKRDPYIKHPMWLTVLLEPPRLSSVGILYLELSLTQNSCVLPASVF